MTKNHEPVIMDYIDEEGLLYRMTIIKHFTFGTTEFVLASEAKTHHCKDGDCHCHDHHQPAKEKPLYVFEYIRAKGKLKAIGDETLEALKPMLEAM